LELYGSVTARELWSGRHAELDNAIPVSLESHEAKAFRLG